jgi:hypothetical protein
MRYVADSIQGFAFFLAGLKAWLEHGIQLDLALDHCPMETKTNRLRKAAPHKMMDGTLAEPT